MKKEFMTVGELADLMGVTVRTLQYYDKEGLLKPSSFSEGGRRRYTAKDAVKLHQILAFKYLGFSLEEIRHNLFPLDTPREVAAALRKQKEAVLKQIRDLEKAVTAIDALYLEVTAIQEVDFQKYAEIIELLKRGSKEYWIWKFFDETLTDHIKNRFSENPERGEKVFAVYKAVLEEAIFLKRQGIPAESEKGFALGEKWWDMVLEFTGGDMSLIPKLIAFNDQKDGWDSELAQKQMEIDSYLEAALSYYFTKSGLPLIKGD